MPASRSRFLISRWALSTTLLTLLMLPACSGVTGPARRHLAAVEAAERALTLPAPERRRALENARDELRAALQAAPRLPGAKLTLATLHARLDEASQALELAPDRDEQAPEERAGWEAIERWALARAGRWEELIATPSPSPAIAYRDFVSAPPPCAPGPEVLPAPTACCADSSQCRDCLAAARAAWCGGAPAEAILAATEAPVASPHLELARAHLRAVALTSLGRHGDARLALDIAREAALRLSPSSTATAEPAAASVDESAPRAVASLAVSAPRAVASLDLDRAISFAWSGEVDQSRALLTAILAASPPEPLLARARALAAALSPPAP